MKPHTPKQVPPTTLSLFLEAQACLLSGFTSSGYLLYVELYCRLYFFYLLFWSRGIMSVCLSGSIGGYGNGILSHYVPGFWVTVSPHRPVDRRSHQLPVKTWRLHAQSMGTLLYENSYFQLVNGKTGAKVAELIANPSQFPVILNYYVPVSLRQGLQMRPLKALYGWDRRWYKGKRPCSLFPSHPILPRIHLCYLGC